MDLKGGHKDAVQSAQFNIDDTKIITVAVDRMIIVWDIVFNSSNNSY